MEKLAMTVKEMGHQLGISLPKAYDLTNIKGFPVICVGRRKIIPLEGFRRWLEKNSGVENESDHSVTYNLPTQVHKSQ